MKELMAPALAQVLLTFLLLLAVGVARTQAIRTRKVRISDVSLGQQAWPVRVTQIGNSFNNQLEMPLLFFVALGFTVMAGPVASLSVLAAWGYVGFRILHALIHVTSNHVPQRFAMYAASNACLAVLWIQLAIVVYR